jgi:hypothetical protein
LDATIYYKDSGHEVGIYAHEDEAYDHDNYFKVYQPQEGDQGYECGPEEEDQDYCILNDRDSVVTTETRMWWRMSSGRVLGVLNGMLLEYDSSTLAPLGLVVTAEELLGKVIAVVDSGLEECFIDFDNVAMEGADCEGFEEREQAIIYHDPDGSNIVVIQPNEDDGSYWRKIVRNKIARMKERRRENAALLYAQDLLGLDEKEAKKKILSTWGPYTSTVGNAL